MILHWTTIHQAGSHNGVGFNSYQLRLLGVKWPPKEGWLVELVGEEIQDKLWSLILELRNVKRKSERKRILKRYGLSPAELFRKPPHRWTLK